LLLLTKKMKTLLPDGRPEAIRASGIFSVPLCLCGKGTDALNSTSPDALRAMLTGIFSVPRCLCGKGTDALNCTSPDALRAMPLTTILHRLYIAFDEPYFLRLTAFRGNSAMIKESPF
jgi:hypothetical protein